MPKKHVQRLRNQLLLGSWKEAVKHGAELDGFVHTSNKETLLHLAEDAAEVKALLTAGANPSVVDWQGRTPLHRAQNAAVASLLVEAGAPLDVKDREGKTPLATYLRGLSFSTPSEEDLQVVEAMLKRGAQPNGATLAKTISAWKTKPSHAKAFNRLGQRRTAN